MARYTLPKSLVVEPEREVPSFQLKVEFDGGPISERRFITGGLNDLWSLLGLVASIGEDFLFQLSMEDITLELLGCYNHEQDQFCLFRHLDEKTIVLLDSPELDFQKLDLVKIVDHRWPLVFFVPKVSFFSFETLVTIGNEILISGELPRVTEFPQTISALRLTPEEFEL